MFEEHASVELTRDLPESGLVTGSHGAIVHVHAEGAAFEVEFFTDAGETIDVVTVEAKDLRRRDRSAAMSAAVEAGDYTISGPVELGPASGRPPRTAAELILALRALDPSTLVLVEGYGGGFSPIASISDDGPVQELAGRAAYYGRYAHPETAAELVDPDRRKGWQSMEDPVSLVGEPVQAVVLAREENRDE
ncbi:DUF4926 domain-containing protein [Tsukamurella pulmonis]|uniref:DUF4926 domain-containing protein n=1 Tax=Tsukamurella pulmonis TaxID=47312 RepID=UPI000E08EDB5|nr:DUF4926 domain-containing protein [Tsukamurella pulmonis]RDH13749.1 DUF4926 domain-containing protein [Tsukamurella pulmonis]